MTPLSTISTCIGPIFFLIPVSERRERKAIGLCLVQIRLASLGSKMSCSGRQFLIREKNLFWQEVINKIVKQLLFAKSLSSCLKILRFCGRIPPGAGLFCLSQRCDLPKFSGRAATLLISLKMLSCEALWKLMGENQ